MVVFSFFRGTISLLEEELVRRKIPYCKVWGEMKNEEKARQIREFRGNPEKLVLLATDAIQTGEDLQIARHLVNVDLPFSHEGYEQRMGRVKRLNSPHQKVIIWNLLMKGSFEERQLDIVLTKGELDAAIRGKSKQKTIQPVKISLRHFLKETV
jgi:SNF2 family DNA or RNA helicase